MSMVKGALGRILVVAALALLVWPPMTTPLFPPPTPLPDGALAFEQGRLLTREGWLVLVLEGAPYEMGVQQGVLLGARLRGLLQDVVYPALLDAGWDGATLLRVARASFSAWPAWAQEEARGVAAGAGIALHDVVLLNAWPFMLIDPPALHADLARWSPPFRVDAEMALAARPLPEPPAPWPTRPLVSPVQAPLAGVLWAAGGEVNATREWLAGGYLSAPPSAPYGLVVVRRPPAGRASLGVALPGWVGVQVGMQDGGLTIGWAPLPTQDRAVAGAPPQVLVQAALSAAHTHEDVPEIVLGTPRLVGGDLLAVDAEGALRVLFSGRMFAVETADAMLVAPTALPATMAVSDQPAYLDDAARRAAWLSANAGFLTRDAYASALTEMGGAHPDGWLAWYAAPAEGTMWLATQAGAFPAPASEFLAWTQTTWLNEERAP
ncbi:C45 family peptidase [Ardenticatena maritima]|uniref:Uncharacterized protein n=4 Tax=Ardenticatena maritima TaxID=872965 RepID=A0A0P6YYR0_9CHLR|nr:hypothetical protein [Ardenticatena maritima]KPL89347.1 hypothetical protein SE16_02480 [Ardenticatena maritima]